MWDPLTWVPQVRPTVGTDDMWAPPYVWPTGPIIFGSHCGLLKKHINFDKINFQMGSTMGPMGHRGVGPIEDTHVGPTTCGPYKTNCM